MSTTLLPTSKDVLLNRAVRARLYTDGPIGDRAADARNAALDRFDTGVGEAVAAVTEPYRAAGDEEWFDELRTALREVAMDAALQAIADELQAWLALRADVAFARGPALA